MPVLGQRAYRGSPRKAPEIRWATAPREPGVQVVAVRGVSDASGVGEQAPLTTLLSWVWIGFTIEADNAFEAAGTERVGRACAAHQSNEALRTSLQAIVSQRAALAEGLIPPEGCWRGAKPHLAQTQRMLIDPAVALPWHPMVLHRGGWPDGS
jgi:hypothetical protein